MSVSFWVVLLLQICGVTLLGLVAGFVLLPLILASITLWRHRDHNTFRTLASSLYVGRVWHTRFLPKHHGFQYPLFVFALDLEEVDTLFSDTLWPLSWIVTFRAVDHLKNGEGLESSPSPQQPQQHDKETTAKDIAQRVLGMIASKTNHKCQPTLESHRVVLVTHLCYYGYCFNPVSFYYVQEKQSTHPLTVVVAEVSNTPWNEMHCYVLHPDSVDQVVQTIVQPQQDDTNTQQHKHKQTINYVWPKRFHVSPFMEMDYTYDWTFTNFLLQSTKQSNDTNQTNSNKHGVGNDDPLVVRAAMKRGHDEIHFTAKMQVFRKGIHPSTVAWQLVSYPIYCFIIQVWIHYEAFWLFVKGIVFVPHPNDTETAISRVIAAIMTPLFAMKEYCMAQHVFGKGKGTKSQSSSSTTTTTTSADGAAAERLQDTETNKATKVKSN